ncbi:MAG: hypothetical protein F6K48_20670 [Okeania sp. SIO3H1]|nr:hypothetical protein [Okeania sp. SIO3H1]
MVKILKGAWGLFGPVAGLILAQFFTGALLDLILDLMIFGALILWYRVAAR